MKNRSDLIDLLRREAARTQGFVAAADAYEELSSLEGQAENAVKMRDDALAERHAALADLEDAMREIEGAKEAAANVRTKAQADASALLAEASENASQVAAQAAKDAEKIKADAHESAQSELVAVTQKRNLISSEIVSLNVAKKDAQDALDSVSTELTDKQAALARVQAAIAELKA